MKTLRPVFFFTLLAACSLLLAAGARAADPGAVPNTRKSEVIYANLNYDGAVGNVIAVNSFNLDEDRVIIDYGAYLSVSPLTTITDIKQKGEIITAPVKAGAFYYQGDLGAVDLPWDISITYTLDGKEVGGGELAGQSGALGVEISVRQNPNVNPLFFENYALQISVTLDGDLARRIVSADAVSVAASGTDKLLSFVVFSAQQSTVGFSAEVTDFAMDSIQLAGVPLSFNTDSFDFDTAQLTGGLNDLSEGIAAIDEGADELDKHMADLESGAAELADGASQLAEGMNALRENVSGFGDGADELADAADTLRQGADDLAANAAKLADGADDLAEGSQEMYEGLQGSGFILLGASRDYNDAVAAVQQAGTELYTALYTGGDAAAKLTAYDAAYQELVKAAATYYSASAVSNVADNYAKLNSAVQKLSDGLGEYAQGAGEYAEGLGEYHSGMSELTDGVSELSDGISQLTESTEELSTALDDFYSGLGEFADGLNELADGAGRLAGETDGMDQKVADKIDELLDEYANADFAPVSFVSAKNTVVDSVQFVMLTPAIVYEEPAAETNEQDTRQTIWDRLVKLGDYWYQFTDQATELWQKLYAGLKSL